MKTCTALLTALLLGDAALTARATESLGLTVAVVSWLLLYPLLAGALPNARTGLRWLMLFAGLAFGAGIDFVTARGFHWFTGVTAVAAAGHFAGWTGAVGLLFGNSKRARIPTALGRPGCFNTSFAASILLAYLCQTDVTNLSARPSLIFSFVAAMLGFVTWELGRSAEGRDSTVGKSRVAGARRFFRWLVAAGSAALAFLLFAQVLPMAAQKATQATGMRITGDSFNIPDMPDLDTSEFRSGKFESPRQKRAPKSSDSGATAVDSVEGFSGGFSQDVAGGNPDAAPRIQEFSPGTSRTLDSSGAIANGTPLRSTPPSNSNADIDAAAAEAGADLELAGKPAARSEANLPELDTSASFWSLPSGLVWPVLLLTGLVAIAAGLIIVLLRSKGESDGSKGGSDGPRRPMWDHAYIPAYLKDFLARAAELGFEKERGQTLREFLRSLRRRGVSNENFPKLSEYHYRVQFESARRNDAQERHFRRESGRWLQ